MTISTCIGLIMIVVLVVFAVSIVDIIAHRNSIRCNILVFDRDTGVLLKTIYCKDLNEAVIRYHGKDISILSGNTMNEEALYFKNAKVMIARKDDKDGKKNTI